MSYNSHVVIDMDSHIREYWDVDRTYGAYIDPEYREKYAWFSRTVRVRQRRPGVVGFSQLFWPRVPTRPLGVYDGYEAIQQDDGAEQAMPTVNSRGNDIDPACNWDPAIRLRDMDTAGIDISVMFPSQADGFCMLRDVGFESALHRAYHRFMNEYCAKSGGRLWWVAVSTMRNIPETIAQLRYCTAKNENFAGMFIPRACPDGSMLDNPDLYPLYEASQELDMPLWVHGGANRPPLTPWVQAPNGLYHSLGGQYAMAALVGGRRVRSVPQAPDRSVREFRRLDAIPGGEAGRRLQAQLGDDSQAKAHGVRDRGRRKPLLFD